MGESMELILETSTFCFATLTDDTKQDIVIPRGFYVSTSDIWTANSWSDPVFFDVPGIDQDVGCILSPWLRLAQTN
jgi:hypothetical protein